MEPDSFVIPYACRHFIPAARDNAIAIANQWKYMVILFSIELVHRARVAHSVSLLSHSARILCFTRFERRAIRFARAVTSSFHSSSLLHISNSRISQSNCTSAPRWSAITYFFNCLPLAANRLALRSRAIHPTTLYCCSELPILLFGDAMIGNGELRLNHIESGQKIFKKKRISN